LTVDTLIIRPFQKEDCEAALRLASDLGLSAWTLRDYREELKHPDSEMIAALAGSRVVGFMIGRRVPGSGPDETPDAEIYNIGVEHEFQRSGVGTRLMLNFIERCRRAGVRYIWLEVRAANTEAIGFYGRFGFIEYAVRPNFYRNPPDNGIVMRLGLDR
jgi:ribosomal-protein-alanine acetyltransferase